MTIRSGYLYCYPFSTGKAITLPASAKGAAVLRPHTRMNVRLSVHQGIATTQASCVCEGASKISSTPRPLILNQRIIISFAPGNGYNRLHPCGQRSPLYTSPSLSSARAVSLARPVSHKKTFAREASLNAGSVGCDLHHDFNFTPVAA